MNTIILLIILCIFLSIILGIKTDINIGLFATAFAYLIGCFGMHLSVSNVISFFSIKILFLLMSVSLFFGFAIQNKTLDVMANHIIYKFQKNTKLLPFVLFFVCFLISAMGASAPAVCSFMSPICFAISVQTGISPLIMAVLISTASGAGACVPWGIAGAIMTGIIEESGYTGSSFVLVSKVTLNFVIAAFISVVILFFMFKGYKAKTLTLEKPEPMNSVQKKTLTLLVVIICILTLPSLTQVVAPNPVTAFMAKYCEVQMMSIIGTIICCILKLGDFKKIVNTGVPWSAIISVCGISMLIGLATEAGVLTMFTSILEANTAIWLIILVFMLVGGFLSFFTGGVTVVIPMLLPIAMTLVVQNGENALLLACGAVLGGLVTATSPFSTGGSLIVASITDDEERTKMINKQFAVTFLVWGFFILFGVTGLFGILN